LSAAKSICTSGWQERWRYIFASMLRFTMIQNVDFLHSSPSTEAGGERLRTPPTTGALPLFRSPTVAGVTLSPSLGAPDVPTILPPASRLQELIVKVVDKSYSFRLFFFAQSSKFLIP
jgi:hypothetical protein